MIETLVWLRVPGDVVFAIGALALGVYAFKLLGARLGKPTLVPGSPRRRAEPIPKAARPAPERPAPCDSPPSPTTACGC